MSSPSPDNAEVSHRATARLPSIRDFATDGQDPGRYVELEDGWWVAVADVRDSTGLVAAGQGQAVNFVAGAAVAVLAEAASEAGCPAACQFGGDGAVAVVPPQRREAVRAVLAALAEWAPRELGIPLRVGMVPVAALRQAGHQVQAALQDFGNDNVFGLFLGSGVSVAERWMKAETRWQVAPEAGPLPGLEKLSCRWRPVPSRRGVVLCLIIDPLRPGAAGQEALSRWQAELEATAPSHQASPLGRGETLVPGRLPSCRALGLEGHGTSTALSRWSRWLRAVLGVLILGLVHRLGGRMAGIDTGLYRRGMAERSDYRKLAGGPRLVLDVTEAEAARIEALLDRAEAAGDLRYGLARAASTTLTCLVGDFAADRHIHFVDGQDLGFWRAASMLKAKP